VARRTKITFQLQLYVRISRLFAGGPMLHAYLRLL